MPVRPPAIHTSAGSPKGTQNKEKKDMILLVIANDLSGLEGSSRASQVCEVPESHEAVYLAFVLTTFVGRPGPVSGCFKGSKARNRPPLFSGISSRSGGKTEVERSKYLDLGTLGPYCIVMGITGVRLSGSYPVAIAQFMAVR